MTKAKISSLSFDKHYLILFDEDQIEAGLEGKHEFKLRFLAKPWCVLNIVWLPCVAFGHTKLSIISRIAFHITFIAILQFCLHACDDVSCLPYRS